MSAGAVIGVAESEEAGEQKETGEITTSDRIYARKQTGRTGSKSPPQKTPAETGEKSQKEEAVKT